MVVGVLHINNCFFVLAIIIFGCNRSANCGTQRAADNGALAATNFRANGRTNTTTDSAAQYGISINCKCRHTGK